MESAIRIEHPRKGIPAWNWEPVDERPEKGEYWNSRGPGYPDVSGFMKTKAAGERILAMVHEVLGTDKCKTSDQVNQRGFNSSFIETSLIQRNQILLLVIVE